MRPRCVLALTLLAACGRVGFDRPGDGDGGAGDAAATVDGALAGDADEDGDGLLDADDPCPHLAAVQLDSDADGIGDECDPNPSVPGDKVVLFASLAAGDQPFVLGEGGWTQDGGAIVLLGVAYGDLTLALPTLVSRITVRVGFTIDAVGAGGQQRQVSLHVTDDLDATHQFVELNEIPATAVRGATVTRYTPPSTYTVVAQTALPNGVHPGDAYLSSYQSVGTKMTLDGGWLDEPHVVNTPADDFTGASAVFLTFNQVDVHVRYVWIVSS